MKGIRFATCFAILATTIGAMLPACAVDESVSPRDAFKLDDGGAPMDAKLDAGSDAEDAAPDAPPGPPKRTVIERNPFGNVAESANLLRDGDFGSLSPFWDKYVDHGPPFTYQVTGITIGSVCRSGIQMPVRPQRAGSGRGRRRIERREAESVGVDQADRSLVREAQRHPDGV